MAFEHGSGAHFSIDNSGGTPQDISSYVTNVSGFPESVATHDTTTYGNTAVKRTAGLKDLTFTVNLIYDSTVDDILAPIMGLEGTYTFGPQGNTSGDVRYTGECILQNATTGAPVGDMVTIDCNFERSGAGTRDTFP